MFVCLGNICRSPTAEAVFQQRLASTGWQSLMAVESSGTAGWHVGKAPDERTVAAAARRGYDMRALRARQLIAEDLQRVDYVFAMDTENLRHIHSLAAELQQAGQPVKAEVALFTSWADGLPADVPDPYYGGADGFEQVLDLVEQASDAILRRLLKQRGVFGCAC